MSRKNKFAAQKPAQQPILIAKPTGLFSGLIAAVSNVAEVLQSKRTDWNEKLFFDIYESFPESRRDEFKCVINEFMQLGKAVRQSIEEAEGKTTLAQNQLNELDTQRSDFAKQLADIDERTQEIKAQESSARAKEVAVLKKENELLIREENATSGFLKEYREATKHLHAELIELNQEKTKLHAEIVILGEASRREIEQRAIEFATKIEAKQEEFFNQEARFFAEKEAFELEKRKYQREQKSTEQLESILRAQVSKEFEEVQIRKDASISKLTQKTQELSEELDELQNEIDEFRDLEDALAGDAPNEFIEKHEELRRDCRQKDRKISELEALQSRDTSDALRLERDRLDEELRNLRPEYEDLKRQNNQVRLGVMEKENWMLEKKIIQKSNELMSAGLRDLKEQIHELTDDKQHQGAFPELCDMDRKNAFQTPVAVQQVTNLQSFTEELRDRIAVSQPNNPLFFNLTDLQLFVGGLAMSQLHVFQGISGTGKTSLAKAFAKSMGGEFTNVAVQAGWRDKSDLLGHYNAFEKRYYEKDCLQALYKAQTPSASSRINVILLDEMNLSRPEQYFADFLSALEMEPGEQRIPLMESAPPNPPKQLYKGREISIPENVWFIGTANQDETTNELADKTHDRAFVMELHSRHKEQPSIQRKDLGQATYSSDSLKEAFKKAQKLHKQEVQKVLAFIGDSELTKVLEGTFRQGWGNRLERQALRFLPVVKEAGGTFEMALDHILATRMFRAGKVTGRYDITVQDLTEIESALTSTWGKIFPNSLPDRCMQAIEKDMKRLGRGG